MGAEVAAGAVLEAADRLLPAVLLEEGELVGRRLVGLETRRTAAANQALGHDSRHRRGDEEGLDAHVEESVEAETASVACSDESTK